MTADQEAVKVPCSECDERADPDALLYVTCEVHVGCDDDCRALLFALFAYLGPTLEVRELPVAEYEAAAVEQGVDLAVPEGGV